REQVGPGRSLSCASRRAPGHTRRNKLSAFVDVKANGKIAMKLEKGDRVIGVLTCAEADDVLLAASDGQAIRFPVADVRVFSGRTSMGVRGIRLEKDDHVISMSILRHVAVETSERAAFLRMARKRRGGEEEVAGEPSEEEAVDPGLTATPA